MSSPEPAAPLRILVVTAAYPEPSRPAWGSFIDQQVQCLRRRGHHVDVCVIRGYRSRLNYIKAAFEIRAQTTRLRYDLIHAHYGLSALPALFGRAAPLVITLHGSDVLVGRLQPLLSLFACTFADGTIAVSQRIASIIPGEVIPTGVDFEVFKPIDRHTARQKLGLPHGARLVLFPYDAGRKEKRHGLAQAAVDLLRAEGHDARLLAVSNVRNEEMPWYYNAADVMILCSESEGSPTTVKEALACGVPVVSTDVGDVSEITAGNPNAFICTAGSRDLAEGLKRALAAQSLSNSPRASALSRYDQRNIISSIEALYRRVSTGRHVARPHGHLFHSLARILAHSVRHQLNLSS